MRFRASVLLCGVLALSGALIAQTSDNDPLTDLAANGKGRINYSDGTIRATGYGAPPVKSMTAAQAKLMAMGAARADALRNLAMTVSSVQVTGQTKVKNYVLENDTVETKVSALLQSPRVVSESSKPDGTAVVTMELPMYGDRSVASVVVPEVMEAAREASNTSVRIAETAVVVPPIRPPKRPAPSAPVELPLTGKNERGAFTSLIIDCRGLGIQGALSPKVYDTLGREVYGTMDIDIDEAIEYGIVAYPRSAADALKNKRAGRHPLVIKALRPLDTARFDVVISEEDADRVREANRRDGFLKKLNVIFVVDR